MLLKLTHCAKSLKTIIVQFSKTITLFIAYQNKLIEQT